MRTLPLRTALVAAALLVVGGHAAGCPGGGGGADVQGGDVPRDPGHDEVFHTLARFVDREAFFAWADTGATPVQAKFTLTSFSAPEVGEDFVYDPTFYDLHDEWYWFKLLNGSPIAGFDTDPVVDGPAFDTVDAVYAALNTASELPLDLRRHPTGRIWSQHFYDAALNWGPWAELPRFFGIGSLLFYPPDPARPLPDELWLFELEYADTPDEVMLQAFFDRLEAVVPPEVAGELKFLSRGSAYQNQLVAQLRAGGGPLAERVVLPAELVVPGEVVAYNTGITAGRIRRFEVGELGGASVEPRDIAILAAVPDYLPPVAGIVTAVPQTPLAHLNLLAKARGTPNAYVGGVMDDPLLRSWAGIGMRAILKVTEQAVRWRELSTAEWLEYLEHLGEAALEVPPVDLETAPTFVDLEQGGLAGMAGLVPLVGGKNAGMLAFLDHPELETPYRPLAVSVRPYAEHLASYRALIEQMLADEAFGKDARLRFLVLEGREDFVAEHAGDAAALGWLERWDVEGGPESQLGQVVASGGLKQLLRSKPLAPAFEAELRAALEERYAALARTQGLRFRSSSTAEDVPGFNGAGLYDSNTGYLYAEELLTEKLRERTIAWALKKTWASYWSFEAFEERRLAGIDHLSGNMAVLVHPRFDDALELANGVITFTLREEPDDPTRRYRELVLNVQHGAISVTNPDPLDPTLPEIDRVAASGPAAPEITRVQPSTEVPVGTEILSDEELVWVYDRVGALASDWLSNANSAWSEPRRATTLVLDLEFKRMAAAWPAMVEPTPREDRLVFKQVRVLDSAIAAGPELAGERCGDGTECPKVAYCKEPVGVACEPGEPIPRDLLSVAARVQERRCAAAELTLDVLEVTTDVGKAGLLGHSEEPFVARVSVAFLDDLPGLTVSLEAHSPDHTQLDSVSVPATPDGDLVVTLPSWLAAIEGWRDLVVRPDGRWTVTDSAGTSYDGAGMACEVVDLLVGPSEFLEGLLGPL